jgi:SAM-dependent methyltransferase
MDVKEEDILGEDIATHWYYVSKGRAMRSFLGAIDAPEVLDIGAGSGIFSRQLLKAGVCQRATCVDPAYAEEREESCPGGTLNFVRKVEEPDQPLVLMMDVLEHVDDDVGLLREYSRHLPAEGRVLITVPAFRFLWSGHDEFLEHRRRYTRGMVERMVQGAGLEVVRNRYFYGMLFPVVAAMRLYDSRSGQTPQSALRRHSTPVNSLLTAVHDVERVLLFPVNILAGLSVFCLARPRR